MPKDKDYTNVPHHLLDGAATSLAYGNTQYGEGKKREASSANDRYNSLVGHLQSYHSGEMRDKESGLLHLDCAAMQLAFLMEAEAEIEGEMVGAKTQTLWVTWEVDHKEWEVWEKRPKLNRSAAQWECSENRFSRTLVGLEDPRHAKAVAKVAKDRLDLDECIPVCL